MTRRHRRWRTFTIFMAQILTTPGHRFQRIRHSSELGSTVDRYDALNRCHRPRNRSPSGRNSARLKSLAAGEVGRFMDEMKCSSLACLLPGSRLGAVFNPVPFADASVPSTLRGVCHRGQVKLPAFRHEPRDLSVPDVAELRAIRWCRCYARRYAKPLAISLLLACCRAEPSTGSLQFVTPAALLA